MKKIGVIGVGNKLMGDDGIALEILDRLTDPDVDMIEAGTGGMKVVHDLAKLDRVLIIDAGDLGIEPGDFRVFIPDDAISIKGSGVFSFHDWDVMRSLEISKALGEAPEEIHIMGIQIEKTGVGKGISYTLKKRIPEYLDKVKEILESMAHQ